MISRDDVLKLAGLARISLSDEEVESLEGDIAAILKYIETIQEVELPDGVSASPHLELKNSMRDDGEPHESGMYTDELVSQFPRKKDNYLEVKKILS